MRVLKIPGTPFKACVRRAFWWYHYLRTFLWVDTRAPGITSDWYIYAIRAVYGCLVVWEPHQWCGWLSGYGSSRGPFPQSRPRRGRRLWARLEKYASLSDGTFLFSLTVLSIWVPGHNSVPGNVTMFFSTTMVCYSILGKFLTPMVSPWWVTVIRVNHLSNQPPRSTQPCIPPGSINRVPA